MQEERIAVASSADRQRVDARQYWTTGQVEQVADMVQANPEGDLVPSEPGLVGISWNSANIRRVMRDEPLACAAAACIALTWKYRELILGR